LAAQLSTLYAHNCLHLAAGEEGEQPLPFLTSTKKLVLKALKRLFKAKGKVQSEVDPDLWQATFDTLDHAIKEGLDGTPRGSIQYDKPNFKLTQQLRESAALFSAQKSWAQATELAKIAASKPGYQITWKEFKEAAKPIVGDYNERWLKTEYNTAIRAARQASLWKQYEATAHLYPNLRYMASRAATPRQEHKPYYGIVRPINDDFWIKHMPPSAWNCLCGVEQTDDDVTPLPVNGPTAQPGLDHNPGLTGKLFSDTHPLAIKAASDQRRAARIEKQAADLKQKRDYEELRKNKSFMSDHDSATTGRLAGEFPALNRMELAAVRHYTGNGFGDLNGARRGQVETRPYLDAFGDVLQVALDKLPAYQGTTYRRSYLPEVELQTYRDAHRLGNEVRHSYFTSTSKLESPPFGGDIYFVIKGKTGRDIEQISHYSTSEQEVLFPAEARFRVDKIEESGGMKRIYLTELDQ
jgi:hypothetical protein